MTPCGTVYQSGAYSPGQICDRPSGHDGAHRLRPTPYDRAITYAAAEGARNGKAAASWVEIPDASTARVILAGMADSDPAVLDTLPAPDLSGEWADTLTGPQLVEDALSDAGVMLDDGSEDDPRHSREYSDWFSDICDAYETAFSEAAEAEITSRAQYMTGAVQSVCADCGRESAARCPFGAETCSECSMYRERDAAGRADTIADCPAHGAFLAPDSVE